MVDDDPTELRRRAAALRDLARRIDGSALHDLGRLAGEATWRGPAAEAFLIAWRQRHQHLAAAAASLRRVAADLEHRAASTAGNR